MSIAVPRALSAAFSAVFLACLLALPALPARAQAPDRESLECAGCHESSLSAYAPFQACHDSGCGHEIGLDYAVAAAADRSLAPPASLREGIRLVEGRISCVTCHVPYSAADHEELSARRALVPGAPDPMLSVDNAGSALCMACHLK